MHQIAVRILLASRLSGDWFPDFFRARIKGFELIVLRQLTLDHGLLRGVQR